MMTQGNPSSSRTPWVRVTKQHPCPICRKDSWCLIHPSGEVVLCMRVLSPKSKLLKSGETGYLHQPTEWSPSIKPKPEPPPPVINCRKMIQEWVKQTFEGQVKSLAQSLGVTATSLHKLGVCWATPHAAWAFPMRDGYENMVGIRLRKWDGSKFAVKGSHQGCFIPTTEAASMALVAEGPTDAAAGLDLGYYVVGRPSCSGGMNDIAHLFKRKRVTRAAIVSDNDGPGLRGAEMLARNLPIATTLLVLPCKDLREFVKMGGTKPVLDNLIGQSVWHNPQT